MNRCDYCRYKNTWDCEDGCDRVQNDKICDDFVLEFNFLSKKQQKQIQKILMRPEACPLIDTDEMEEDQEECEN
jgi:hypothetical protein